jgi:hypothetical protein
MYVTCQIVTQIPEFGLLGSWQFLAQEPLPQGVADVQGIITPLIQFIPRLLASAAILAFGWLIAAFAKKITQDILKRTSIDTRIASGVGSNQDALQVERLISDVVFWSIILLTIVSVLQTLGLELASRPINNFLDQLIGFLPKVVGAGVIFTVAWFLATIVKIVTVRGLQVLKLDERLNQEVQDSTSNTPPLALSQTIGTALYWFIFLLFLIPVLDTLGLKEALQPVQTLTTQILSILPNILAAGIIGTVGWFLAKLVQRIVANLLVTTGIDNLGQSFGLSITAGTSGTQSISAIIANIVYVLTLIPVAIAALNALKIEAISLPAIGMLQQVLNTLPSIFTAIGIFILAYFLGKFAADIVTSILTSFGFNNIFSVLGLPLPNPHPEASEAPVTPTRTPSEIAGIIVLVGILLFATVASVNILNIPALTILVSGVVVILGRILAGLIVFAIGLFLANLAFNIISSSGSSQAKVLAQVARISIIALVSAMALEQVGVATNIVNLAFGLLFGAIAVAIAIAFGLGSRDIAQEQVREWLSSFKSKE